MWYNTRMNKKFLAKQPTKHVQELVTETGRKFIGQYHYSQFSVGEKVFMAKRTNNHHGETPIWEVWEFVVEESSHTKNFPKTWYGGGRYLFKEVW